MLFVPLFPLFIYLCVSDGTHAQLETSSIKSPKAASLPLHAHYSGRSMHNYKSSELSHGEIAVQILHMHDAQTFPQNIYSPPNVPNLSNYYIFTHSLGVSIRYIHRHHGVQVCTLGNVKTTKISFLN